LVPKSIHVKGLASASQKLRQRFDLFFPDILISTVSADSVWAVVGDWEAGRFLLPEIDLCGSPLTLVSGSLDQAEDPAVNNETLP
jgi:hypothetical protein